MSHIFISYARKDIVFAEKVVHALAAKGLDTWIDWKSIPKTVDWEQELYRGIEEADAFLFMISPDSVRSQMCNKEIAHAVGNNKRIIPIVTRDTELKNIPLAISKLNWIFSREEQDNFDSAIEQTRVAIHTDYEWLRYHTQLQNKALAWERRSDVSRLLRGRELREAEQVLANSDAQRDPQPTSLQRHYVLVSQRQEVRIRRQVIAGLMISVAIMATLSVIAWLQRDEAISQRAIAQAASTSAVNEANTRATAQSDAETQANIALARQLGTQAELIYATQRETMQSLLLAIQSMRLFPNPEASLFLQRTIDLIPEPINRLSLDSEIVSVEFSLNGNQLFAITGDQEFQIWDWEHGQGLGGFRIGYDASEIIQDPNSKEVLVLGHGIGSLWDIETKTKLRELQYDVDAPYLISSDLHWMVTRDVQDPKSIQIYDLSEEGSPEHLIHPEGPDALAISPNNQWLATGSADGAIRLWRLGSNIPEYQISVQSPIKTFTFSQDDRFMAVITNNNEVYVIEVADSSIVYETQVKGGDIGGHPIIFSPDSTKLIIGESYVISAIFSRETGPPERSIAIVDVENWHVASHVTAPIDGGVAFHKEGRLAAFFGGEWIYVVDLIQGEVISKIQNNDTVEKVIWDNTDYPSWIAALPNHSACDLPICVPALQVWDLDSLELSAQIGRENIYYSHNSDGIAAAWRYQDTVLEIYALEPKHEISITLNRISTYPPAGQISFSPNGEWLVVNQFDSKLYVYAVPLYLTDQIYNFDLPVEINDSVNSYDISPDSRYVATAGRDRVVRIWDIATGEEKKRFLLETNRTEEPTKIVFSPSGRNLAIAQGNNLIVWDINTGRQYVNTRFDESIYDAFYSPDGQILAIDTSSDIVTHKCVLWDVESKRVFAEFSSNCSEYSPDGKSLLGVVDESISIWSIATGMEEKRIVIGGHTMEAKFSPDGLYILTVTFEGKSRMWDIDSGNIISELWQPADIVISADVSPDGERIAMIGGYNNIIRLVYWKPDLLISEACARANRNLSRVEWRMYLGIERYAAICPDLPTEPEPTVTPIK